MVRVEWFVITLLVWAIAVASIARNWPRNPWTSCECAHLGKIDRAVRGMTGRSRGNVRPAVCADGREALGLARSLT
jgi:hypothetical protein